MAKSSRPESVNDLGTADDLPAEYVPKELRPPEAERRDRVMYACGFETVWKGDVFKATYAMWAGPFPEVQRALYCVPPGGSLESAAKADTSVIVRFNLDGTDEVIYRWFRPPTGPAMWRRAQ